MATVTSKIQSFINNNVFNEFKKITTSNVSKYKDIIKDYIDDETLVRDLNTLLRQISVAKDNDIKKEIAELAKRYLSEKS